VRQAEKINVGDIFRHADDRFAVVDFGAGGGLFDCRIRYSAK
jgi:DNA-binding IscR family transcriptional regulator